MDMAIQTSLYSYFKKATKNKGVIVYCAVKNDVNGPCDVTHSHTCTNKLVLADKKLIFHAPESQEVHDRVSMCNFY